MSSHTPGPWHLSDSADMRGRGYIRPSSPEAMREDGSRPAVARVSTTGIGYSTFVANAQLIAAAPDLLDACQAALRYLNRDDYADADLSGLCTTLRDAVSKAGGK